HPPRALGGPGHQEPGVRGGGPGPRARRARDPPPARVPQLRPGADRPVGRLLRPEHADGREPLLPGAGRPAAVAGARCDAGRRPRLSAGGAPGGGGAGGGDLPRGGGVQLRRRRAPRSPGSDPESRRLKRMGALPTIYTARSEAPPEHQARVDDWYVRRHAPDLLRAGFYSVQVYHAEVGTPLVCNLYEIPGHDLFRTQAYRDVAAKDTEGPPLIALLTGRSDTAYDQRVTVGIPAPVGCRSRGERAGGVDAPAVSTPRFDLPEG